MTISGTWYNELGSTLTLVASDGTLSGTYETAVGGASGQYPLTGRYNTDPSHGGQAASWSVAWQNASGNANSSTGWSGQYQQTASGQEEIHTMWLLASETEPDHDWGSVQVGSDTFTRAKPTDENAARATQSRPASHPRT